MAIFYSYKVQISFMVKIDRCLHGSRKGLNPVPPRLLSHDIFSLVFVNQVYFKLEKKNPVDFHFSLNLIFILVELNFQSSLKLIFLPAF